MPIQILKMPTPPEGWEQVDRHIEKTFTFDDFKQAFAFMTQVALEAEKMSHHPDWENSYNKVTIRLTTHEVGHTTGFDYELAEKINKLL